MTEYNASRGFMYTSLPDADEEATGLTADVAADSGDRAAADD